MRTRTGRDRRRAARAGHTGREYWSKRPTHYPMAEHGGKGVKADTHRCERRANRAECTYLPDDAVAGDC